MNKNKKNIILLCIIFVVFLLFCYIKTNLVFEKDITKFSDKTKKMVINKYAINLPESFEFIKGYETIGFDAGIWIYFTVEKDEFETLLSDGWVKEEGEVQNRYWDSFCEESFNSTDLVYSFIYSNSSARLCYYIEGDLVYCVLIGDY